MCRRSHIPRLARIMRYSPQSRLALLQWRSHATRLLVCGSLHSHGASPNRRLALALRHSPLDRLAPSDGALRCSRFIDSVPSWPTAALRNLGALSGAGSLLAIGTLMSNGSLAYYGTLSFMRLAPITRYSPHGRLARAQRRSRDFRLAPTERCSPGFRLALPIRYAHTLRLNARGLTRFRPAGNFVHVRRPDFMDVM
jgi:hypothetical protein